MSRPQLEVADIFRQHGEAYRQAHSLSRDQLRVMQAIESCRTAVLGGHVEKCESCGHIRITYNSCRDRHCPKCQSLQRAEWLDKRMAELLPVTYFHVVFTLPEVIAPLALQNKRVIYNILFRSVSKTLLKIAADPKHLGVEIGFTAVLHTWGQNLLHHPHLHCIVAGGGLSIDGKGWIACRDGFFLPVRVLSRLFRRLFIKYLKRAFEEGSLEFHGSLQHLASVETFSGLLKTANQIEWVVYAKQPFGGPAQVLNYLGHYTHRVAISNHRLLSFEDGKVTFSWKDYRDGNAQKAMTLDVEEFIRRFLLHVLPSGLQRIRHFGFLANRHSEAKLALCRQLLGVETLLNSDSNKTQDWKARYESLTGREIDACPVCQQGRMQVIEVLVLPAFGWHRPKPGVDSS
ncbi:MAG: IS91 family transposase [Acidobacteriota bacterium]